MVDLEDYEIAPCSMRANDFLPLDKIGARLNMDQAIKNFQN